MRPATYERLWVVFDEVRCHDGVGRERLLDERCAGDAALRAEVAKLLEQVESAGTDFLAAPGPLNFKAHWPTTDDAIGRRVGPYEIRECLGAGGMGCVYLAARREDFEQRVAIKWIKPGLDTADVLRRFRAERQVLAGLRHPHIAALLDGGTLAGRPYFVMEHIDGTPIDQFCASHRLGIPERLRLFLVVCGAVQHAHQNLILHRDLKPGNILVDANGSPKLLDFGIAKVLTAAESPSDARTLTGQQYATPEYASPEQLCGDAPPNTAGDIYSLGVILYELLTGRRPHEANGRSALALARAVCEDEPTPPRRWRPDLPYDLEVVCLRCLHKDPARRFPSVASLADELERCLAGRPIQSRAVGVWEQAVKWGRRRPSLAGLIGVSVLAVLGLLALSLTYNRRLEGAVASTSSAKNDLQLEKDRADANVLITLGLLEKKLVGVRQGEQKEWLGPQKRQELQEVLDRFQALRQINDDSPAMTQLRARAYGQMAAVQELLGDYTQAERSLEQALELQEGLRRQEPDNPAYRHELADTFHALGRVRADARRAVDAETAYREAIRLHEQLATAAPEPAYRDALGREYHNLGNLLARDPARKSEARVAYEQAIRLHEQLAREQPDASYPEALALHRSKLRILDGVGLDEKETNCRQRINDLEKRADRGQASPTHLHQLAMHYHELGKLLAARAREDRSMAREAEDALERAVELHTRLVRDNPEVLCYRRGLAQHYLNLGDLFLWTARRPQKAQVPYAMALALFKELAARDAAYQGDLGCTYEKLGQLALRLPEPDRPAAEEQLRNAVTHLQKAVKAAPDNCHYRKVLGDATKALHELKVAAPRLVSDARLVDARNRLL